MSDPVIHAKPAPHAVLNFIITYADDEREQDWFDVEFQDAADLAAYSQLAAFRHILEVAGPDWSAVVKVSIAQHGGEHLPWLKLQWKYYFGPEA